MEHDAANIAWRGATPLLPQGPPPWPVADKAIEEALQRVLRDHTWGRYHGAALDALQGALAEYHGVQYVTLCCSGTVGIELALRAVQVEPGDEVILAGYDFPGNFRAIEAIAARPVLVDIDPATYCLSVASLEHAWSDRTRAILVSHLHGGLADMRSICDAAEHRGVAVVEDACQAVGARLAGRPAGSWGNVGVLSFGGSKLLAAGRGGAVVTNDAQLHQRAQVVANRGNETYPLSLLQATVLLPQLQRLDDWNRRRSEGAARIRAGLKDLPGLAAVPSSDRLSGSLYKLAWQVGQEVAPADRDTLIAAWSAEGLEIGPGFRGFVRRSNRRCRHGACLEASRAAAEETVLLHHPILLAESGTLDLVVAALRRVWLALGGAAAG